MATMSEQEMQELAEKLVTMPVNKARGYTRRLDPDSATVMLRVGHGHELWTRYRLPGLGVLVTLVEMPHEKDISRRSGNDNFDDKRKFEPEFVEARVEPLS